MKTTVEERETLRSRGLVTTETVRRMGEDIDELRECLRLAIFVLAHIRDQVWPDGLIDRCEAALAEPEVKP